MNTLIQSWQCETRTTKVDIVGNLNFVRGYCNITLLYYIEVKSRLFAAVNNVYETILRDLFKVFRRHCRHPLRHGMREERVVFNFNNIQRTYIRPDLWTKSLNPTKQQWNSRGGCDASRSIHEEMIGHVPRVIEVRGYNTARNIDPPKVGALTPTLLGASKDFIRPRHFYLYLYNIDLIP